MRTLGHHARPAAAHCEGDGAVLNLQQQLHAVYGRGRCAAHRPRQPCQGFKQHPSYLGSTLIMYLLTHAIRGISPKSALLHGLDIHKGAGRLATLDGLIAFQHSD